MLNFTLMRRFQKPDDETSQGDGGEAPKSIDPLVEKETDEFGYAKVEEPKNETQKPSEESLGDKKTDETKVETSSTGYGEEPPKVEETVPPETETPPNETPPEKELGFEIKTDGLPKDEVTKLVEFAKKHSVTKEVAQAYADLRKEELVEISKAEAKYKHDLEIEKARTRASWHKELKDDPSFGGDKFGHNIVQAEKVLQDFMPETKKALTERKAMLPPYFMRDLAKMAAKLYETEKLVEGEPPSPPKQNDDEDDPLSWYHRQASGN